MPIDTSSYYPELPDHEGSTSSESQPRFSTSLFGEDKPKETEQPNEPQSPLEFKNEQKQDDKPEKISAWEKCANILSNFISWALVPLMMPVYGIIFAFGLSILDVIAPRLQVAFTFIVFGINFCIPMVLVLLLKFLGVIQDVGLNGRKERLIPYIITALCLGGTAWFMASRDAPIWLDMFYVGGAVAAIINLAINFKWKISAHAAGIAGIVALLIRMEKDMAVEPQLFVWLLIVIGAAGLMGTARIWLRRHTTWQVLAGYAVGFCSVFFLMSI